MFADYPSTEQEVLDRGKSARENCDNRGRFHVRMHEIFDVRR